MAQGAEQNAVDLLPGAHHVTGSERSAQAVLDACFGFDIVKPLLPALETCLSDDNESIREDAADVLGEIESREMLDVFVRHLSSPHEDVRDNAEFYLLFWTDESFTNTADWVPWWASNKESFVFE